MKTANSIIQAVLGAAVIVLFVLHFTNGEEQEAKEEAAEAGSQITDPSDISIAYFNMDSVMSNWDLYFEYQQELERKQAELESDIAGKTENFREKVQDAQYKIQRGLVTRSEAEELQQEIASQEQNLMSLQNRYSVELQEEGMVKQRKLLDMIERYVAELSRERGYSYVYSYTFGGNLIYGAEPYNITKDVVAGLNARFKPGTDLD